MGAETVSETFVYECSIEAMVNGLSLGVGGAGTVSETFVYECSIVDDGKWFVIGGGLGQSLRHNSPMLCIQTEPMVLHS